MMTTSKIGMTAVALVVGGISTAMASDYTCISGARIPMTVAAAQASGWNCTTTCAAQLKPNASLLPEEADIFSRDNPDKKWGPPYTNGKICIVYVDPGKTTRARYGDGARCFYTYSARPADPCQAGDLTIASERTITQ
ncbi:hypothetical protein [Methylobacterium sp. ap11]|uniref:hypothetical protein n=1 Tax=Methylobacterium sp. ap11 TaxID=1761799 RepID=UPI001160A5E7|nr:hypothetical protein [Methylobacterium sp. ap11]